MGCQIRKHMNCLISCEIMPMHKQTIAKMTTGSSAIAHDLAIKAYPSNLSYGIIVEHLAPTKRCIDLINPDGNCMFRAVSKELLGTDRYHFQVSTLAVEFMATNPNYFSAVLAKYQSQSLKEHILHIKVDHGMSGVLLWNFMPWLVSTK